MSKYDSMVLKLERNHDHRLAFYNLTTHGVHVLKITYNGTESSPPHKIIVGLLWFFKQKARENHRMDGGHLRIQVLSTDVNHPNHLVSLQSPPFQFVSDAGHQKR